MRLIRLVATVALLGALPLGTALASNTPPAGSFQGCPSKGVGGDPDLNVLKNRAAQVDQPQSMTVAQINALPFPPGVAKVNRAAWPQGAKAKISPYEQKGAFVVGYLKGVRQEGPEATNCGSLSLHDYHLWLVDTAADSKAKSIVVEITPRWRGSNPGWKLSVLTHLASQGARFRITGWLMLDQDHPEQIGKTREGLWEIHPITKIEVFSGGKWVEL